MKKQQNNSTRAWALRVALLIALLSISAVLLASSSKTTPATRGLSATMKPVAAGDKDLVTAGLAPSQGLSPADAPFTFDNTGTLNTARYAHTATLLPNGKVLMAGEEALAAFLAASTDIGAFEVQGPPSPYAGQVQQPINADGTSVFNGRRGVVPVSSL